MKEEQEYVHNTAIHVENNVEYQQMRLSRCWIKYPSSDLELVYFAREELSIMRRG